MARSSIIHDRSDLAKIIASMTYVELLAVSSLLVAMVKDGEINISHENGMADLLTTWAECELDREEESANA